MNHHFETNVSNWLSELGEERREIIRKEAEKIGKTTVEVLRQWILEYSDELIAASVPSSGLPEKLKANAANSP